MSDKWESGIVWTHALEKENAILHKQLEVAREALKASNRCYKFIVALHKELDQMKYIEGDKQAFSMAQMKLNLFGYLSQIWSNGELLKNDETAINDALAEIERIGKGGE
jgi:hypothetical protein